MPKRKKSPPITKEQFLARVLSRKEPNREKVIKDILKELHAFEMKYRMRSEIFFKFIVGTPLEDQQDFLDWGMCYREYLQIFQTDICSLVVIEQEALNPRTLCFSTKSVAH